MTVTKIDYEMEAFDEESVELMLKNANLNSTNYLIAMTKPSLLNTAAFGIISEFANRYCIISFSETELNLIMLSRISNKKATEIIKIQHTDIKKISLSNILISYMLNINTDTSSMKFQVFKKVARHKRIKESIELFKKIIFKIKEK